MKTLCCHFPPRSCDSAYHGSLCLRVAVHSGKQQAVLCALGEISCGRQFNCDWRLCRRAIAWYIKIFFFYYFMGIQLCFLLFQMLWLRGKGLKVNQLLRRRRSEISWCTFSFTPFDPLRRERVSCLYKMARLCCAQSSCSMCVCVRACVRVYSLDVPLY